MGATIRDVAKAANVSRGTVSRYINGLNLNEDNRLRVEKAIEELNYKVNIIARGLKNNRTMTIGVVIRELVDFFNTSIVSEVEKVLEENGYGVIICDYEDNDERLEKKLRFLKDRSVDGIILFATGKYLDILEEYQRDKIPVVLINDDIRELATDKVMVDNINASFRAAERLIQLNHRKIAIINRLQGDYVAQERLKGFLEALEVYNIPINKKYIVDGGFTAIGGYQAAKNLLQSNDPPTAIYVASYYMGVGALMAINELNVRIPDDISIISFDYFQRYDISKPALTCIEQPVGKIGITAANLVLKRVRGDYSDFPKLERINTRMLIRDSDRAI